jgi:hypothetical protein
MSSEVSGLVDSIKKHLNFKRLAAFSIGALNKQCSAGAGLGRVAGDGP